MVIHTGTNFITSPASPLTSTSKQSCLHYTHILLSDTILHICSSSQNSSITPNTDNKIMISLYVLSLPCSSSITPSHPLSGRDCSSNTQLLLIPFEHNIVLILQIFLFCSLAWNTIPISNYLSRYSYLFHRIELSVSFPVSSHSNSTTTAVPQSRIASSNLLCASITTEVHFHHFYAPIYSVYFSAPPTRIIFSLKVIMSFNQPGIL